MSFAARENLLDILRAANIALFYKSLGGRYLFINDAGAELVGRRASQIVGHHDREIFAPRTADVIALRDQHIANLSEPFAYDCRSTLLGEASPIAFHSIKVAVCTPERRDPVGLLCLSLRTDHSPDLVPDLRELLKHLVQLRPERLLAICRRGAQLSLV